MLENIKHEKSIKLFKNKNVKINVSIKKKKRGRNKWNKE